MKILIVQLRRIGDILLTTPAIAYMKQAFPDAHVHFLAEPAGKSVLETNPLLEKLIIYERDKQWAMIKQVRSERYDAVVDFMNNPRSGMLTFLSGAKWRVGWKTPIRQLFYNVAAPIPSSPEYVPLRKLRLLQYWLEKTGVPVPEPVSIRPKIHLSPKDESVADVWMKQENLTQRGFVVFAPASRHSARRWREEGYRKVAADIVERYKRKVYLAWGPGEEKMMASIRSGSEDKIGLLPLTSMREMAAIYKQAALVVTTDSGSLHTAVSVDTPTVSIHGPTRPVDWSPALAGAGKYDIPLNGPADCLGCHYHECPIGHLCMKNLTEERVFGAVEKLLQTEGERK